MVEVEVRKFKEVEMSGGTIIEAIPSVGLASTIASTFLIATLGMDQVCALESEEFPPLSMIYAKKPKFPARVYVSSRHKLCVFICEVPLPPKLHRPVARTLLSWGKGHQCKLILSLEGLPSPEEETAEELDLWGVGSTDSARSLLDARAIPQLETGVISGVSGVLLNEGRWQNFDVISLLAEARPLVPDAAAAAKLVEGIAKLLPDLRLDLTPLHDQAINLEEHLRSLKEQARPAVVSEPPLMYR